MPHSKNHCSCGSLKKDSSLSCMSCARRRRRIPRYCTCGRRVKGTKTCRRCYLENKKLPTGFEKDGKFVWRSGGKLRIHWVSRETYLLRMEGDFKLRKRKNVLFLDGKIYTLPRMVIRVCIDCGRSKRVRRDTYRGPANPRCVSCFNIFKKGKQNVCKLESPNVSA